MIGAASLTGHLVLSTLHTNDAIDSALRMMDMEAPGYLVASSVRAVVAQRLVRRVCSDCVESDGIDGATEQWLKARFPQHQHREFLRGRGCQSCNFTGYKGRIGVFELLEMNQPMMDALRDSNAVLFSQIARGSEGYKPLIESAMDLALEGRTSLDEVLMLGEGDYHDSIVL